MFVVGKIVQDGSRVCTQKRELKRMAASQPLPRGKVGIQEDSRVSNDYHGISRAGVNFAPLHSPLSASIIEIARP
jgi:hypothetical protein